MKGLGFAIFLQLIGLLVIFAEVLLPSGGLLSLVAVGIFGYSLHLAWENGGQSALLVFILADLALIPPLLLVSFRLLARSPVSLRTVLSREGGVSSQEPGLENFVGLEGKTLSTLRPAGIAQLDRHRVDVMSHGEFIEQDVAVVVVAVNGNRILVKRKTPIV